MGYAQIVQYYGPFKHLSLRSRDEQTVESFQNPTVHNIQYSTIIATCDYKQLRLSFYDSFTTYYDLPLWVNAPKPNKPKYIYKTVIVTSTKFKENAGIRVQILRETKYISFCQS